MPSVIVVGGGHAAAQFCSALVAQSGTRWRAQDWRITLVTQEAHPPYHRPPLSKQFLRAPQGGPQPLLGAAFYAEHGMALRLRTRALAIDRVRQRLGVAPVQPGAPTQWLAYDHLVLATGACARGLPQAWGQGVDTLPGVHVLRTLADAQGLAQALRPAGTLAVLGGGFIGLEVAATAAALGWRVHVLEAAPRLLARAVSPAMSEHLHAVHRSRAVALRLGVAVGGLLAHEGRFAGLTLADGALAADRLLVGIGSEPQTALAHDCGLACDNGIAVDAGMGTQDPHISAIGDCAAFPHPAGQGSMRLESVQNAQAHAELLARRLLQADTPVPAFAPWFWSEQGDTRLQIAGLWQADAQTVRREGSRAGSFSLLHYAGARLQAVESVNAPADHMAARRWLARGHSPPPVRAGDAAVALKDL